jgi:membrane peptidoglycan carboxypeptidase
LNPRSLFVRKLKEWALALHLEARLSKSEIAVAYVNTVNFCADGVAGISHAAWHLFGVRPEQLSKAQSAMLAGLIQQPTRLSPWNNLKGAVNRQRAVLRRMRSAGHISATEERTIRAEQINLQPRKRTLPSPDPVVTTLRQRVQHLLIDVDPTVRAFTTFHEGLQKAARTAASRIKRAQTAIVALDAKTGAVLAMVGRRPSSRSQFNRATNARRSTGSIFKPFVAVDAVESGFDPADTIPASPWRPGGNCSPNPLSIREMLIRSDNCAAAGLVGVIGPQRAVEIAERVGFRKFPAVPSIALGTGEATPLEVAAAFSVFATVSLGKVPVPYMIAKVKRGNRTLYAATPQHRDAIQPEVARIVSEMLGDVVQRGTARAVSRLPIHVVGKTGTSDSSRDAWFAGVVDGRIVVVVWVGFDRPSSLGANAADIAVPVWIDFVARALRTSALTPRRRVYEKQATAN